MSELIQKNDNCATIRWKLLTGASALALMFYVSTVDVAKAEDASQPQIWIELGGQLSRLEDKQEIYSPPFLALEPSQFTSPLVALQPPRYSIDTASAISFQPEDSNWIFAASIRYGRAGSKNHFHQQTYPLPFQEKFLAAIIPIAPYGEQFIDAKSKSSEDHAIVDFQAGKDLGLGIFGHDSSSSLSVGVRIAQFKSKSLAALHEDPDWYFHVRTIAHIGTRIAQSAHQPYHSYAGQFEAERSFHGIGPSLSWKSSAPFAGNRQDGALTLDWGLNASLLFGRQNTRTQHYETAQYHHPVLGINHNPGVRYTIYHHPTNAPAYYSTRARNVAVPNVGGFAALSFNYTDAKISLGYRADVFFGAIDGGIDTRKSENRAFYGPYASISIGLGD